MILDGCGDRASGKEERPRPIIKTTREAGGKPLKTELDLRGEFTFPEMLKSRLGNTAEVNRIQLGKCAGQVDVKMRNRFPG